MTMLHVSSAESAAIASFAEVAARAPHSPAVNANVCPTTIDNDYQSSVKTSHHPHTKMNRILASPLGMISHTW